ncbi:hypothetical protein P3T37_005244 [Kitasatospora sp. MAA4]|uniref:hypothetical protein n=1 Tax=Kitasatospora sp. MAA4 TaxID=3035093 RepID=UPI0024730128|nr:hypothetical protein [Kitasatospora sp. MAA4]MDH6135827.1 hypothetical protein [Kitasatospora sp. MAA4]
MGGWLWSAVIPLLIGGNWIVNNGRAALKHRHERKLEILQADERQRIALEAANRPPEPICGCTHHLAKHDRQGKCHELVQAPTAWDADRKPLQYEPRPCNCQQYIGPEPLGTVFAAELTDLR